MKVSRPELKEKFVYILTARIYFARQVDYLGLSWNDTHGELALEGKRMPTIEEFRRSLNYLRLSKDKRLQEIYRKITEVRDPWRGCHIDDYFKKTGSGLWLLTKNKTKAERLENCLMEDKTPGISINSWLSGKNTTGQGLPKTRISNGDLYYWCPVDDSVARFDASSDWAGLNCNWDPDDAGSSLGVFAVADA